MPEPFDKDAYLKRIAQATQDGQRNAPIAAAKKTAFKTRHWRRPKPPTQQRPS